jgi:hypothetical protein
MRHAQDKPWTATLHAKSITDPIDGEQERGEWGTPVNIEYSDDVDEPPTGYQPPVQLVICREDFDFGDFIVGENGPQWRCPSCPAMSVRFCYDDVYLCDECDTVVGYLFWLENIPAGLGIKVEVRA